MLPKFITDFFNFKTLVILLIITTLIIYYPSLTHPFFQDDFLLLHLSQANSLTDLLHFLKPIANFPYRPLATHFFYWFLQSLFGLNYVAFHLVTLSLHFINTFLVFRLALYFTKHRHLSLFGAYIFSISATHYMTLFWIATAYFLKGTTFFLAAFLTYLAFPTSRRRRLYFASLVLFLFGLLTLEVLLLFPLLLLLYHLLLEPLPPLKLLKTLFPFFLLSVIFLLIRLVFSTKPDLPDYQFVFSLQALSTLRWYLLRSFSLPEGIKFISSKYLHLVLAAAAFLPLLFSRLTAPSSLPKLPRQLSFSILWYLLGALPFFFLPHHLSIYYLEISTVGFVLLLLFWLQPNLKNTLVSTLIIIVLPLFFLANFASVRAMQQSHWVSRRGQLAGTIIRQLESQCRFTAGTAPINFTLSVPKNLSDEARIVTSDFRAVTLYCHQP